MDAPVAPFRNPIEYMVHCIRTGEPITGPLSVETSRIGQQIVDSAVLSARERRIGMDRLPLANGGRVVEVYQTGEPYLTVRPRGEQP